MSEYLARLKAERPDVDWDAEMAAARKRRERAERSPWQRFRHWVHAQAHPDLHREKCSKCRREGTSVVQHGGVIATPPREHDCAPGWTTKTGSDGRPYGIPPSSWDYPEGTVWECPCGKTWVSGMRAAGSFFARWHPESRWARWRRTRRAG